MFKGRRFFPDFCYIIMLMTGLGLLNLTFTSCRKTSDAPAGSDTTNNNQIIVTFPKTTIATSTIDSVVVFFTNGTTTVHRKATQGGTFYTASFNGLAAGSWSALTKVYTNDSLKHMYRTSTTISTTSTVSIVGPTGKLTDTWKPSILMYSKDYSVILAVAVLPTDPYFEIILPSSLVNYKNLYLERNAYNTVSNVNTLVQTGNFIFKASDYKGFHSNTTAFSSFAANMGGQNWKTADFSLQLYNDGTSSSNYKILFSTTVSNN